MPRRRENCRRLEPSEDVVDFAGGVDERLHVIQDVRGEVLSERERGNEIISRVDVVR